MPGRNKSDTVLGDQAQLMHEEAVSLFGLSEYSWAAMSRLCSDETETWLSAPTAQMRCHSLTAN